MIVVHQIANLNKSQLRDLAEAIGGQLYPVGFLNF